MTTTSPEVTRQWKCPNCSNRTDFVGYDEAGYPGADCTCGAYEEGLGDCICAVELQQPFTVDKDTGELLDYEAHDGGYDSEIGEYTRIECRECLTEIWQQEPVE